ncbi:transaldolase [Demequina sp.]|uniref:transaldolase n=1 Tax=Demequina sp. TaxID=2050685 RepID=UPI003D13C012
MSDDRLGALSAAGVSIWLDDLSRERLETGSLAHDVEKRHIVGVTTNPSIFAAAVKGATQYDAQLADLGAKGFDAEQAVRALTTDDVRAAADVLRGVFEGTDGVDGRVSIEVDPRLAHDTAGTVAQAKELWEIVDRPNVLIKIPATVEGLPAITDVLAAGISVNVTLIFSLDRYAAVLDAFLDGLEQADTNGHDLASIASVASFFVSRVDSEVDKRLEAIDPGSALKGTAAIANARLAFEHFEQVSAGERWQALAAKGARPQRPLWASTSTKDPSFPDTMYVDELITAGTVNTMPQATIDAFDHHGSVPSDPSSWDTIRGTYDESRAVFARLAAVGIDFDDVTRVLEQEGVDKFIKAWEELLGIVGEALKQ